MASKNIGPVALSKFAEIELLDVPGNTFFTFFCALLDNLLNAEFHALELVQ